MKNAAMMAVGDINNNNLVVQFYDTKGTGSGARIALENALNAKSDLILGPLKAEEVLAISNEALSKDVPVVSFSTSPSVLQEGIYSIGLLNDDQIKRIVRYSADQGRRRLAAVLPDNQVGINMFKSLLKAAQKYGVEITKVGFYSPTTMDFGGLVTSMIASRSGDDVGFDALLVPEFGNRLKAITSMFSYYDVSAPNVLFMGTSVWANTGLSKETELYGAVYPVMPLSRIEDFNQKYSDLFGNRPHSLGIYAYDAVTMASILSHGSRNDLNEEITRNEGFSGMSGTFRILPNGLNEHGLDVVKITAGGPQLLEAAMQQFYNTANQYNYMPENNGYVTMPQIYGKDAETVRTMLNTMQ
jgi:ABC-type branched-subunit amino acid transport system substrate-binding protein